MTLTAGPAAASPGPSATITSSPSGSLTANGSTPVSLTWQFTDSIGPVSCELLLGATVARSLGSCATSATFTVADPGRYTFKVLWGGTPLASAGVTLLPVAPTIDSSPPSPGSDPAPQWSFSQITGSTASCVLSYAGTTVQSVNNCSSPFTATDLTASHPAGANGLYKLDVSQQVPRTPGSWQTLTSAGATSVYDYEAVAPAPPTPDAPTVTADVTDGFSVHPTFTVTGTDPGATLDCSVTGPSGGPTVTVSTCDGAAALDLTGGDDGTYTLSVTQTDDGVTSAAGSASYSLDIHTPTITADSPVGAGSVPTFTVTNLDPDTTLECSVSDPSEVTVTSCGPSTAIDLTAAGDDTYTVSVDAKDASGDTSATASASYEYESATPPAPVVTAPSVAGNDESPTFAVTDSENVDLSYSCTVSVPATEPPTTVPSPACGPTTTLDLTGAPDGSYTLTVTATDGLDQTSPAGSASYTLDTSTPAPVVTLTAPTSSPSTVTAPTYAITDSESLDGPDLFGCEWDAPDGTPVSSGPCSSGDAFPTSGDGDGTYTLTVTATDAAGNTATATPVNYELETGPPPAPIVVAATPFGNSLTPSFSVTDADNVDLTYDCAVTGLPAADITSCGPTTTLDLSSATDGPYPLVVTVTDGLGHASLAGSAIYTLDTSTPAPLVALAPPLVSPSSGTTPSFLITDTEFPDGPDTFSCVWQPPTGPAVDSPSCLSGDSFAASEGDGTYTLTVTATDSVGNTATAPAVTYTLDTTPPAAPTVTLATGFSSPGNATSPQFTVTDADSSAEPGLTYACTVTGPTAVPTSEITCGSTTSLDLSGPGRDGTYTLAVAATDSLGNVSLTQGTATYTLDTMLPAVPTVTLSTPATSPGNVTDPQFTLSDLDSSPGPGLTFNCSVTGATAVPSSAITCGATTTIDLSGANRDGAYTLSVTATDPAGNTSTSAGTASYTLDTVAPEAPSITLPASSTKLPEFGISDADPTATLTCLLLSPAGTTVFPTLSPGDCPSDGTFDTTGFGDGSYTLTVTATDPAQNTTATTVTWVRDTTPPAAPTVTLASPLTSPSNVADPQFLVSDPDNSPVPGLTYTCSVTGPTAVPSSAITCGAPTTSVDLSGSGRDGTYTLSVTATDAAGNVSTSVGTATYTLDTTAPPAPAVALAAPRSSPSNATHLQFAVSDADTSPGSGVTYACAVAGPTPVLSFAISCGTPRTLVDLSGPERDGTYTLSVTATDAAGNVSTSAGTATYTLDATAPLAPVVALASATRSDSKTPLWTWQFGFNDLGTGLDSETCTVTGPHGWSSTTVDCGHHFTTVLRAGDGGYRLTVTLTDEAGNTSSATSPVYLLDSKAPAGPTVFLRTPSRGAGLSRDPIWVVSGPPGATLLCTLIRGGHQGTPVGPEAVCPSPVRFNLAGMRDGLFTLRVIAVDAAHDRSFPAWASYALAPTAPHVRPPNDESAKAVWTVTGNTSDTFVCTLTHNGRVVAGPHRCGSHPTYHMARFGPGDYTLSVVEVGAEGVRSAAGSATWFWDGVAPILPGGPHGPRAGGHHPTVVPPTGPKRSTPPTHLAGVVHHPIHKVGRTPPLPAARVHHKLHPNRITQDVVSAVQGVVHAVGAAGGGTGFPLLLLAVVLVFVIAQNRIDRRDPKLALASVAADDMVEFQEPPSRRDRP